MKIMFLMLFILALFGCKDAANKNLATITDGGVEIGENGANDKTVTAQINDVVQIREKMFIAQTNDIYVNKKDYLGKTIKYEGIFKTTVWETGGKEYCNVVRFGPGCCGFDAPVGFEVDWNKDYPKENDWVEAVGVLEEYRDNKGYKYLRLALTSLNVLDKRGEEKVVK